MIDTDSASVVAQPDGADSYNCEVDTRSVDELEDEIAELCTHIDAATYRLLRAIGELDRREAWAVGFESTAHWLTWKVGIDMVTAREKVRVARYGWPGRSTACPRSATPSGKAGLATPR